MEYNVYAPPSAVVEEHAPVQVRDEFYVVGKLKLALLLVATFGLYQIYWGYRHWKHYSRTHGEKMLPAARSIFQIFYTHALTRSIDESLKASGQRVRWSPGVLATVFVLVQIGSRVFERMTRSTTDSPITDALSLGMLLPIGLCMWAIQARANLACGDAAGARNRRLGWANGLWIAGGGCLWLLVVAGFLLRTGVIAE
jgi:hypothetical protein